MAISGNDTLGAPDAASKAVGTARDAAQAFAICFFLCLLVWVAFGQTIRHGFLNYDDDVYIYKNGVVAAGLTPQGLLWAFKFADIGHWHPLTWISHMLDCQLWGLRAAGHHLTNVGLHAGAAVFLFLALREMTGALWRSACVAALFALHPQRVESVAWIAERKDVLSGFFFMATLLAYAGYVRRAPASRRARYALVVLLFALGLLAKGMVVTLPFLLLLLDYWPLGRLQPQTIDGLGRLPRRRVVARLVMEKLPLFLLAAASSVMTGISPEKIPPALRLPFSERVANAVVSYVIYLKQMLLPLRLEIPYFNPPGGFSPGQVFGALVFLLGVTVGVGLWWKSRPYLLVGWFWYLGVMFPVIGLVQISYYARADRYTYLPQVGLFLLVVWGAGACVARSRFGRIVASLIALFVLGALLGLTRWQVAHWRDSETLWSYVLRVNPRNYVALGNLGQLRAETGELDVAMANFQEALAIEPRYADAYNNLGTALSRRGRPWQAMAQYQRGLEIDADHPQMQNNLGTVLAREGRLSEAIPHFRRAIELRRDFADAYHNLGAALVLQGRPAEAVPHFRRARALDPHSQQTQQALAEAERKVGP